VEGLDIPDEFVLLLSNDGIVQESTCKVAWRSGDEVGAKFVAVSGSRALPSGRRSPLDLLN
jgi:hypothetical protein